MKHIKTEHLSFEDKMQLSELIGQKIRRYRLREGMTQTQLANRLGMSYQQIQKYEQGKNRISVEHLWAIGCVLSRSVLDFVPLKLNGKKMNENTFKEEESLLKLYRGLNDIERKAISTLCRTLNKNNHCS